MRQVKMKTRESQSAMEYLMTYGWAVLIIAVILAALYALGIFNIVGPPLVCLGQPNYLCSNPTLSSGGGLTINFGLSGLNNYPITITGLMCNVTSPAKLPSVETTQLVVQPSQQISLVFQCPIPISDIGKSYPVDLWIYYNTPQASGLTLEFARGTVKVTYVSLLWNVTEWTPSSSSVDLLPYSDLLSNPANPAQTTDLAKIQWASFIYNGITGWSYSTDYHDNDVYNGIQTTLFPVAPLSTDNAPCSAPYASHGYTANTIAEMSGIYTFQTWSDDGTEIFYKPVSGGSWTSLFNGAAWVSQPPTLYTVSSVNLPKGEYDIIVEYTDTCDPAGLSTMLISPPPIPV